MYTRKWTRMNYFDSVKMFKKYGLIDNYNPIQRGFHLFPLQQYQRDLEKNRSQKKSTEEKEQTQLDQRLIKKLFIRYPDLKYEPLQTVQDGAPLRQQSYAMRFLEKQKSLIKNGYTETEAFDLTEKLFQDRIERKVESLKITEGLASSNRARSFMNYYQQQAEYESRLKVLRMRRDLNEYERAQIEFQKQLQQYENDDTILNQQQEQEIDSEQDQSIYEKVLYKIVNDGEKSKDQKQQQNQDKQQEEIAQEFIKNTKNIFNKYYERAAYSDRLNGLTDVEIKNQIRDSPTKIKKRSKLLLQKLEKLGVKLDSNGEVDFSQVPYPNIRKKLENNPQVKITLLQKEIDYEFQHKQHLNQQASELRKRLSFVQSELEQANLNNEENLEEILAESRLEQEEGKQTKQKIDSNEFDYSEQLAQINQGKESSVNETEDNSTQNIEEMKKTFLSESQIPVNLTNSSYSLFETYEERQLRIEAKYLQQKITELNEEIYIDEQSEEDSEQKLQMNEEQNNQLLETVEKLRRLKFRIEQKNIQQAKQLLFEEHDIFERDELLVDSELPYENLEGYLRTPKEDRIENEDDSMIDQKIFNLITPKTLHEDLVDQFNSYKEHTFQNKDSYEFNVDSIAQKKEEQSVWLESNRSQNEQEQEFLHRELDNTSVSTKKKSKKEDRKQLLEFIKKANQKKQTVGKTTQKVAEIRKARRENKKKK